MTEARGEERAFYWRLLKQTLFGAKYDLYKIPSPPGHWLWGHSSALLRPDYHVQALRWANKYGGICRFSLAFQHIVLVSDPEVASKVLSRGPDSVPKKSIGYAFFDMATNHLGRRSFFSTSNEAQWLNVRKGTAQAFCHQNIRRYYVTAQEHALQLAQTVRDLGRADSGEVDIQHAVEVMLLNVFLEGLFDIPASSVPGDAVAHAMNLVLEEANDRVKMPTRGWYLSLFDRKLLRAVAAGQQVLGDLYDKILKEIRARGEPAESETRLWACLARLKDPKTGKPLSREQLLPEIGAFILAGFDTSSHTIAWCLFTIATHPDVQQRIREELQAAGLLHTDTQPARELTYDDLARLSYLNCTIDETMRMYPVAATASVREMEAPMQVGPYTVPGGVIVWPMVYALHNSVHVWEDPASFRPERWLAKDAAYSGSGARRFLPFSDGIKNCLGQALGLMEVRTTLATLLGRFWFELSPSMAGEAAVKRSMQMALTLKIKGGLRLLCKPHV